MLQINEEERAIEIRRKISNDTYQAVKKGDASIVDALKKRRGRKKFILIDSNVKERLNKRNSKYLEKVKKMSFERDQEQGPKNVKLPQAITEKEERKIIDDIRMQLEQIQKKEENVINKEKLISLPAKQANKDKKRRRTTHFTVNKNKKKVKQRQFLKRKGWFGKKVLKNNKEIRIIGKRKGFKALLNRKKVDAVQSEWKNEEITNDY